MDLLSSSPSPSSYPGQALTPPSSPPPVKPQQDAPPQQRADAFSVLGKRKAPLSTADNNARPLKRVPAITKRKDSALTQMHLSLGQKIEKRCKECGMVYIACSAEDRELHDQYHQQLTNGCDIGSQFVLKSAAMPIEQGGKPGDCICVVTRDDPAWKRKHARNVLNIITQCLGACEITDDELWRPASDDKSHFQMWMYIRGSLCIAATLIQMPQRRAWRVITSSQQSKDTKACSATERLRRRREAACEQNDAPLTISDKESPAAMGICRIWTAPAYQKQGLAIAMLQTLYQSWCNASPGQAIGKINDVAFSQPTAAGTKLARKWFGKQSGWLVYS